MPRNLPVSSRNRETQSRVRLRLFPENHSSSMPRTAFVRSVEACGRHGRLARVFPDGLGGEWALICRRLATVGSGISRGASSTADAAAPKRPGAGMPGSGSCAGLRGALVSSWGAFRPRSRRHFARGVWCRCHATRGVPNPARGPGAAGLHEGDGRMGASAVAALSQPLIGRRNVPNGPSNRSREVLS